MKIKFELDGMKKQNYPARERGVWPVGGHIKRDYSRSVILSNESPQYYPGLSSRMQFKMQLDSKLFKGQIYKTPIDHGRRG